MIPGLWWQSVYAALKTSKKKSSSSVPSEAVNYASQCALSSWAGLPPHVAIFSSVTPCDDHLTDDPVDEQAVRRKCECMWRSATMNEEKHTHTSKSSLFLDRCWTISQRSLCLHSFIYTWLNVLHLPPLSTHTHICLHLHFLIYLSEPSLGILPCSFDYLFNNRHLLQTKFNTCCWRTNW